MATVALFFWEGGGVAEVRAPLKATRLVNQVAGSLEVKMA